MSTDLTLVQAYLANVQWALRNGEVPFSQSLLSHALALLESPTSPPPVSTPIHIDVGVGLDSGIRRRSTPNEDSVFAITGYGEHTQEAYGLFVVADGMGGHAHGDEASRLATHTLVDTLLPRLHTGYLHGLELGDALVDAVRQTNHVLFQRNQQAGAQPRLEQMGTTITVVVTLGLHAYIANVGDSRTYLFRPQTGLRALTRDHSTVATLVARGAITPEEAYTHEKRHLVTRNLGAGPTVQVDLFSEALADGDLLLLCSDGLWEMTRDVHLASILASPWLTVQEMSERLLFLAHQGGGLDNIGLVLAQYQLQTGATPEHVHALPTSLLTMSCVPQETDNRRAV